jgi:hypothetical protein
VLTRVRFQHHVSSRDGREISELSRAISSVAAGLEYVRTRVPRSFITLESKLFESRGPSAVREQEALQMSSTLRVDEEQTRRALGLLYAWGIVHRLQDQIVLASQRLADVSAR